MRRLKGKQQQRLFSVKGSAGYRKSTIGVRTLASASWIASGVRVDVLDQPLTVVMMTALLKRHTAFCRVHDHLSVTDSRSIAEVSEVLGHHSVYPLFKLSFFLPPTRKRTLLFRADLAYTVKLLRFGSDLRTIRNLPLGAPVASRKTETVKLDARLMKI